MDQQAKITSKGQITIPRAVRNLLGVKPGDSVVFERRDDSVLVRPLRKKSPFAKYRGIGNPGIVSGREIILGEIDEFRGHEPRGK